ncbi:MAG: FAD-dependent oxidoreductase [Pseudomonadales bacterium]
MEIQIELTITTHPDKETIDTDIIVLGGGISGLWLLNEFRQRGYHALLLEKNALGGEQTLSSQGMIHGGIKYALGGFTTPSSERIANMPMVWRDCLAGKGALNLSQTNVLSDEYYLFSDGSLGSRITSFFGSKAIKARVSALPRDEYTAPFSNPNFKGWIYKLQDLVIDTSSLLKTLQSMADGHAFQGDPQPIGQKPQQIDYIQLDNGQRLRARIYVFAAGAGNASLLENLGVDSVKMQRRPLHQVMVCHKDLPSVYAHAVSMRAANKPRVTITTHASRDGTPVWYLGGNLAESGVNRSGPAQIQFARKELSAIFPWLPFKDARWASFRVDRAEVTQKEMLRPDQPFFKFINNIVVCWPTKLTLVPMMANSVSAAVDLPLTNTLPGALPDLPFAEIADAPWEIYFD